MESKLNNSLLVSNFNFVSESQCLFIQKWRELFFYKTINTYQFKLRNSHSILQETKNVIQYINTGTISSSNLQTLISECRKHLEKDLCIRRNMPELLDSLLKGLKIKKTETLKSDLLKLEYRLTYALKIISKTYKELIIKELENAIEANDLSNIEYLTEILGAELVNSGWSARSLHRLAKVIFLTNKTSTSFQEKWEKFITEIKSKQGIFHCYFKLNDLNADLVSHLNSAGIELIKSEEIIAAFNEIDTFHISENATYIQEISLAFSSDIHTAVEKSRSQLSEKLSILSYYGINIGEFSYVLLVFPDEKKMINYSIQEYGLVSEPQSINEDMLNITKLLKNDSINYESRNRLRTFFRQYNLSIKSIATETTYSNLWSSIEALLVTGHHDSNIEHIKKIIPSVMCTGYIQRLIKNFLYDCFRAGVILNYKGISINCEVPQNADIEKTYELLMDEHWIEAQLSELSDYTLLKQRILELSSKLANSKTLKELMTNHFNNITWHIQRLYRVRNNLVHAAIIEQDINLLIDHLHFYIKSTINEIINKLTDYTFKSLGELFMAIEDNYYSLIAVLEENISNSKKQEAQYDSVLIFKGPIFF